MKADAGGDSSNILEVEEVDIKSRGRCCCITGEERCKQTVLSFKSFNLGGLTLVEAAGEESMLEKPHRCYL